jgi:hypothetical protein
MAKYEVVYSGNLFIEAYSIEQAKKIAQTEIEIYELSYGYNKPKITSITESEENFLEEE